MQDFLPENVYFCHMNQKTNPQYKLLFICLGNICRSPAADGVMHALVQEAERTQEFYIDSAGIGDWHVGQLPDPRMRRHGAARGYDFSHRARQFRREDFDRFDHIYVMDEANYEAIMRLARNEEEKAKVHMLADFLRTHASTVIPDPYYGGDRDFEYALDLIEDACAALLSTL